MSSNMNSRSHDKVSLFGIRAPELLPFVRRLEHYYEWFFTDDKVMSREDISEGLHSDITKCMWIDGVGRRFWIRLNALNEIRSYLASVNHNFPINFRPLKVLLLSDPINPIFIKDYGLQMLPVVVFSKVNPDRQCNYILHLLLVLGEYDTELDLKTKTIRDAFVAAKIIDNSVDFDDEHVSSSCLDHINRRVVNEIIPRQPVGMKRMDEFIVKSDQLIYSVLRDENPPVTEIPPILLTQLYETRKKDLLEFRFKSRKNQIQSMYGPLRDIPGVPSDEEVLYATKERPIEWNPLEVIKKSPNQSDESYEEQQFALEVGIRSIKQYTMVFGGDRCLPRGVLNNGAPGAGKTFVLQCLGYYAMSLGLNVMTTSYMAVRARDLGGIHLHNLFKWRRSQKGNIFRMAEVCNRFHVTLVVFVFHSHRSLFVQLAINELNKKANIKFLQLLMTTDVILVDECGQISAEEMQLKDMELRYVKKSHAMFGGTLILGSFDERQIGTIKGMPFLLSSFMQSYFTIVRLEHSVRAHGDVILQASCTPFDHIEDDYSNSLMFRSLSFDRRSKK